MCVKEDSISPSRNIDDSYIMELDWRFRYIWFLSMAVPYIPRKETRLRGHTWSLLL